VFPPSADVLPAAFPEPGVTPPSVVPVALPEPKVFPPSEFTTLPVPFPPSYRTAGCFVAAVGDWVQAAARAKAGISSASERLMGVILQKGTKNSDD
jgi:hypothetical protein